MNAPLRKTAMVCMIMLLTLIASTTWVQFFKAEELRTDPRNVRTMRELAGRHRGPITAGDINIAESEKANDVYAYQRKYPHNKLYAPITGYYTVSQSSTGLEAALASELTGTSDSQFYKRLSDLITNKETLGATVETTIDPRIQQVASDALGDQRGSVVAINPTTGEIIAMVSKPSFDPNAVASHNIGQANKAFKALKADPNKPLFNRAIAGDLYPPGSVFKIVTAAAALESGTFTPESSLPGPAALELPGTKATLPNANGKPCGGSDPTTLATAVKFSCNSTFGALAMNLGADDLRDQAAKFGFGDSLKIPLTVTPSTVGEINGDAELAKAGIGQQSVRVTPLQIAMVSAAVANNGMVMQPTLVKGIRAADQTELSKTTPRELSRAVTGQNAALIREMMRGVVDGGTGKNARITGVSVAGKTGTAQHGTAKQNLPAHNWFTGFAPAGEGEQAQVAVAVLVEDGGRFGRAGSGGKTAAPIAQQVMKAVLKQ